MKIFCSIAFALYVDDMACGAKWVLGSLGFGFFFFVFFFTLSVAVKFACQWV